MEYKAERERESRGYKYSSLTLRSSLIFNAARSFEAPGTLFVQRLRFTSVSTLQRDTRPFYTLYDWYPSQPRFYITFPGAPLLPSASRRLLRVPCRIHLNSLNLLPPSTSHGEDTSRHYVDPNPLLSTSNDSPPPRIHNSSRLGSADISIQLVASTPYI